MIQPGTVRHLCAAVLLFLQAAVAQAAIDVALLKPLGGDDADARIAAVARIAVLADGDALKVLQALKNDTLYAAPDGRILIVDDDKAYEPASGRSGAVPDGALKVCPAMAAMTLSLSVDLAFSTACAHMWMPM